MKTLHAHFPGFYLHSSHVGGWGHRGGRSGSGGVLDFLRF